MNKLCLRSNNSSRGFTIVELLVVIVVIGILAAITIVSYTGITTKANASALQSDLANASQQLKLYQIENSSYPKANVCPTPEVGEICLKNSPGTSYLYSVNNNSNPQTFSLYAAKNTTRYLVTDNSSPKQANQVVASGGTVTDLGGYHIHTFTNNGTFEVTSGGSVEVLVVAGGGGGSYSPWGGGGGGAGGVIYHPLFSVDTSGSINVIVGSAKQDSFFGLIKAFAGGDGGAMSGGSGGGGGHTGISGQFGASIQSSNNGGTGYGNIGGTNTYSSPYPTGSGGGAGSAGLNGGIGGAGIMFNISGIAAYYGGGGGMANNNCGITTGGIGGGGSGTCGGNGIAGIANTGGGGGGSKGGSGGAGGSGIVIVRYPLP